MAALPYQGTERVVLDPYSSLWLKFVVVVDSDALLSSIDNHCKTGRTPRLLRIMRARTAPAFAADHVYSETYRRFPKFATNGSVTVEELEACFEQHYLPYLRWVTTSVDEIGDERVASVTDQTDVPTAQLASLVAPCLVVSGDKHLRRPGIAPDEWRVALGHGVVVLDASSEHESAVGAMGLPVVAVVGGGIKLGRLAGLPWWVSVGVMAGGGYLVLRRPERRQAIGQNIWPIVGAVLEHAAQAEARQRLGARNLKDAIFEPAMPPTAKQQVATVLARAREPLLASEVLEQIAYHYEDVPTISKVRQILGRSSEFTRQTRYRWQLGRLSKAQR